MTAQELAAHFARSFGFNEWPTTYEVDAETYGNCCQAILDKALEQQFPSCQAPEFYLEIITGPNNGLVFKGVELILRRKT